MRRYLTTLTLLLITLGVVASSAFSQDHSQLNGVRAILDRTDQIVEQAQVAVATANYPGARIAIDAAIKLQEAAWGQFHDAEKGGLGWGTRLAQAKKLSLDARDQAQSAVASARVTEQTEAVLQRKLEKLTELIDYAGESWDNSINSTRGSFMESIRSNLEQAWELYRSGQHRLSLKLCNQVEQSVRKVVQRGSVSRRQSGHYERRAEFVRRGIERVETKLAECDSEKAPTLIDQARQAFTQADRLAGEGKVPMAMKALQKARKLAEEAGRECRGQQNLTDRYDRLLLATERTGEQVGVGDDNGRELLRVVYEQLELAAGYLESNSTASASAALRAADLTLGQLKRYLNDSGI